MHVRIQEQHKSSTQAGNPALVLVALSLWLATAESAPSFDQHLAHIFPFLFGIPLTINSQPEESQENCDLLQRVLSVLDACVLVSGGTVLERPEVPTLLLRLATESMELIQQSLP